MSGLFSAGGLISGIDSNSLIEQLMQLERQPIIRYEDKISDLGSEQGALRELRTTLQTLRNRAQDFRFNNLFDQYEATSSEESVLISTVSGSSPVVGSYEIDITQLASSTVATSSAVLGDVIDTGVALDSSGISTEITSGTFTVNGVAFTVDPTTDSLTDIISDINGSSAGVTVTYDSGTDKVTFENSTASDTSLINFGATDDDSNFLAVINVTEATQSTNGSGSTEATSTRNLGAIDYTTTLDSINFADGAVTAGTFSINGISITVDDISTETLGNILAKINDSDAQVTASYDTTSDSIQVVSKTLGSRTVNFTSGTSNFIDRTNLTAATQVAGNDAEFTINGGSTVTRNTNEVSDAIGGVTLDLLSVGTSTVTISTDDDSIVEEMQEFITAFNDSVDKITELTAQGGVLENDGSMTSIETYLRTMVFDFVTDISGDYSSILEVGISTGDAFDSTAVSHLELDEDTFREALRDDRFNVSDLFTNTAETGVADKLYDYLDDITKVTGFLHNRSKSNGTIDQQIQNYNDQIDRVEARLLQKEDRLRRQFTQLEQLSANFQSQSSALSSIGFF